MRGHRSGVCQMLLGTALLLGAGLILLFSAQVGGVGDVRNILPEKERARARVDRNFAARAPGGRSTHLHIRDCGGGILIPENMLT
jgi:hypothetical protein